MKTLGYVVFQRKFNLKEKMENFIILKNNGDSVTIEHNIIEQFKSSLQGQLLKQGDAQYDDARTIWNAMIDRKPALIVRCLNVSDVQQAVRFAFEHQLLTAVKGGGHNIAGNAVCDKGLLIDLSQMKSVQVDKISKTAQVEPGALLADVDRETQKFSLATPVGINSTTGIAGLTLGGGFGWLSRKYGLTIDNLLSVDIVTADGSLVKASKDENADLFWAVRGGGGNFGVVTNFEFKLHKVGPNLLSGLIVFSIDDAPVALKKYREYVKKLSNDTSVWVVLRKAPPLPFLPEEVHGKEVIVFALCHAGDTKEGEKVIAPIRSFGTVLGEHVEEMPFAGWQQAFDPLLTPGARNYWKSHNFNEINDAMIDILLRTVKNLPSPHCEIFFASLGGVIKDYPSDSTAYPHRDADFVMNVHGRWEDASDDERCISWSRDFFKAMAPHATGGVYINFMTEEETARVSAAFGGSFERLKKIKQKYDPTNLFCMNQNIKP